MTTITIDGKPYQTRPDTNLLQACLSAGADLPYFCWHPELGSVGACRQCAVKQYSGPDDSKGRIVMACMTPVTDGALLSVANAESADFRAAVVEWLMTNHPHDCPVCEEGGECHLQDMTVMTGHHNRRYRFSKRTHRNQDLGSFVKHEMNRCIACYRCVRFYRDYAGGDDLAAFASHNNVYFGRQQDGTLENDFSGNLVEVCPTGVFTDKPFSAEFTRKWDMRGAPSVCVHCAVGCNTIVNERAGQVRRVLNRYNGDVNRYFLCDRGRFGYGFVNAPTRIRTPMRHDSKGAQRPIGAAEALLRFGNALREGAVIGIGSPRASLEANFALRTLVGAAHFHLGLSGPEHALLAAGLDILRQTPARILPLHEAEQADAVLVLGEDVGRTAPRLGLALRQSVRQASFEAAAALKVPSWLDAAVRSIGTELRSPLFIATPLATDLDDVATETLRAAPDDIARLGFAVAHRIDPASPEVAGLSEALAGQADRIALALTAASRPLVVCGIQCGSVAGLHAAANIAAALHRTRPDTGLIVALPECNSLGLAMLGGGTLDDARAAARSGAARTVIVLENDLARRMPDAVETAFGNAQLIVLDHLTSATTLAADLVLPVAAFSEADGTLVSSEGRAQRFFQVAFPPAPIQESWRWIRDAARECGRNEDFSWEQLDDVIAALSAAHPDLAAIRDAAPGADFRIAGNAIRSETHRFSGRTATDANVSVRDRKPATNPDAPLSSTMEGYYGEMPGALMPYFWAPSWNSGNALNKFQEEVGGPMRGGNAGVRLFDTLGAVCGDAPRAAPAYHADIPDRFTVRDGEMLVVPKGRLFGSEELSAHAAAAATHILPPALGLPAEQAARFVDGIATLSLGGISHPVRVVVDDALPPGLASFPPHAAPFANFAAPAWGVAGHAGAAP